MTQRKSLDVTEIDIMAELDALRVPASRRKQFTAEQDVVLWRARGPHNTHIIYWPVLIDFWARVGWGKTSERTLRSRYLELEAQGGPEVVKSKTTKRG